MNNRKVKQLKTIIRKIQFQWLKTLLPEKNAKELTMDKVEAMLPDQTHVRSIARTNLSFMTDRWVLKMLKRYPDVHTYKELQEKINNV